MMQSYRLAPMSAAMWVLTVVAFLVPASLLWFRAAPMTGIAILLLIIYATIWLYGRPTAFDVAARDLYIVWPLRKERIARSNIISATRIDMAGFKTRFGWSIRIGVGGLFGQFGYSWTANEGLVRTYISTLGPFALIELHEGRPLLLTPDRLPDFIRDLSQHQAAS